MQDITFKINHRPEFAVLFVVQYLCYSAFLSFTKGYRFDNFEFICHLMIALFCSIIVLLCYIISALQRGPFDLEYRSYLRLFLAGLIANLGLIPLMYVSDYLEPYMILPVLTSMMFQPFLSAMICANSLVSFAVIYGLGTYKLLCYIILTFMGAICGSIIRKKKAVKWGMVIILFVNVAIHSLFYFLEHNTMSLGATYSMAFNTIITFVVIYISMRMFQIALFKPEEIILEHILSKNHPMFEYVQQGDALFVRQSLYCGKISRDLAQVMNLHVKRAEAAGLFYRIEELDEGNQPKRPVWTKYFIPEALAEILYETKGLRRKPQTPESALVYIVYDTIRDLNLQGPDASGTKREMDIHRILNNISSSGILDESGLSMNQILRIKNYLIQYLEKGM